MRNFRKAALAGATAVAVTFGTASIAAAAESAEGLDMNSSATAPATTNAQAPAETKDESSSPNTDVALSSQMGKLLGAWEVKDGQVVTNPADGQALFGSSEEGEGWMAQPLWAQLLYVGSIFAGVSAFIGLIVGPAYNFVVHGL
ncbi:hypothetical protein [Corynebacterium sp. LK2510]|uniref:hypothetical protein n=1 Tax=Corynebacterium sp. LK2510 TaxID=3110472 RepID=UPI0034CF4EE4